MPVGTVLFGTVFDSGYCWLWGLAAGGGLLFLMVVKWRRINGGRFILLSFVGAATTATTVSFM